MSPFDALVTEAASTDADRYEIGTRAVLSKRCELNAVAHTLRLDPATLRTRVMAARKSGAGASTCRGDQPPRLSTSLLPDGLKQNHVMVGGLAS